MCVTSFFCNESNNYGNTFIDVAYNTSMIVVNASIVIQIAVEEVEFRTLFLNVIFVALTVTSTGGLIATCAVVSH